MNNLQIFNNPEFGSIRMVEMDGKPYFVASDVAKALGYTNTSKAINDHCRWVTKRYIPHPQSKTKTLEVNVIPQGDIVRLASHSELPGAEKFESWIYDDVIPTVLNHGAYATERTIDKIIENPDFGIELLTKLKEERQKNKVLLEENARMKPKEIFADAVSASNTSILIGQLAKMLRQNGVDIGQNRLFDWMRSNGYLGNRGEYYNMPTQKSMDMGLLEIKETTSVNPDGSIRTNKTTKVTGKGQQYFINKFLANSRRKVAVT